MSFSKIKDDAQCAICLETVVEAATIQCGHTFCRDCILTSRFVTRDFNSERGKVSKCPKCRVYSSGNIKRNIMLDNILIKIGGKEYKKRIKEYNKESDNRSTLRKYTKTEQFNILKNMIQHYIVEKEVVSIDELITQFAEYSKTEIMFVLQQNIMDLVLVFKDKLIFKHKMAICRFVEDNFSELNDEETIFFMNAVSGGHLIDVLEKRYKFKSPTMIEIESYYENNKKKVIKRLKKVIERDVKTHSKKEQKLSRKAIVVRMAESINMDNSSSSSESEYSYDCDCDDSS